MKKYYEISYTKKVGGSATFNVKARNEVEAIANSKNICHTGKYFEVVKEIEPTTNTAKGIGISI